jgi:2'-hydroxyisoflavone reductase
MKILILGGTVFLGRTIVEVALQRGHTLTLFNRGRTNPDLFPEVEKLYGDRSIDLSAIEGCCWDAAIDTSGYVPRVVDFSASFLANRVELYTFISTLSVYDDVSQEGIDENGRLGKLPDESIETITGETYGPLKALCERAVEKAMDGRALIIRPGLIVGPYDPTDRFTYWVHRISKGGEVLAPGHPERKIQFIDVRDLAEWTIRMVEERRTGIYNATGLEKPLSMGEFLENCKWTNRSDAELTWVTEEFLEEQKVRAWQEMPLWVPESDPANTGFFSFSNSKAIEAGLSFRPVSETISAVLSWDQSRSSKSTLKAGMSEAREKELLKAWHRKASQ